MGVDWAYIYQCEPYLAVGDCSDTLRELAPGVGYSVTASFIFSTASRLRAMLVTSVSDA